MRNETSDVQDPITTAKAREIFEWISPIWPKEPTLHRVGEPCADKTGGNWFCITHKQLFANQFEKDSHIHRGKHRLAWWCQIHGPEQP